MTYEDEREDFVATRPAVCCRAALRWREWSVRGVVICGGHEHSHDDIGADRWTMMPSGMKARGSPLPHQMAFVVVGVSSRVGEKWSTVGDETSTIRTSVGMKMA